MQPIKLLTDCYCYGVRSFKFSGGEIQVEIPGLPEQVNNAQIVARIQSSDDIIQLMLVNDLIRNQNCVQEARTLVVPYFPYARQDRVMKSTESFSLKPIASMINSMEFGEVTILDPHSDVTPALLDNVKVIEQVDVFARHEMLQFHIVPSNTILVSPDAGAVKKSFKIAQRFGLPLITATKHRDVSTGEITGTSLNDGISIEDKDLIIVDDICDGGRTFIELAKVLRAYKPRSISLYVTHGIFSKGIDVFQGVIDRVFTTDSFQSERLLSKFYPLFVQNLVFNGYGDLA